MRLQLPGMPSAYIRLFERVSTTDTRFDIFDIGIETEHGTDSVVVGGSFHTAKSAVKRVFPGKDKSATA